MGRRLLSYQSATRGITAVTSGLAPQLDFFFGTFAPFLRASDRPMAIACSLLLTVPPFPPLADFRLPFFSRCTADLTLFDAAFPYFAMLVSSVLFLQWAAYIL